MATATKTRLAPLEDRVVIRPAEPEHTTASGLVIPDTATEKPQQGEVVAVGPGKRSESTGALMPIGVEEGDIVVYAKYGGSTRRAATSCSTRSGDLPRSRTTA